MVSRKAVDRETGRRLRHLYLRIGDETSRLRLDAGVSLREVSIATGIDIAHLSRIERALTRPGLEVLARIGAALGADLSLRFYSGSGPRLHDRFQAPMVDALLRSLAPRWIPSLEVAVPGRTRGVADVVLTDRTQPLLVVGEAQSEFRRLEEGLRWLGEKAEAFASAAGEAKHVSRLLIVRSTESTREVARRYAATLSTAYPARTSDVFDALTGGAPWPGDGILWMRVDRGVAELLRRPPRGVAIGR
jgi:transcriptional regulator with XRE-family HTH domain